MSKLTLSELPAGSAIYVQGPVDTSFGGVAERSWTKGWNDDPSVPDTWMPEEQPGDTYEEADRLFRIHLTDTELSAAISTTPWLVIEVGAGRDGYDDAPTVGVR